MSSTHFHRAMSDVASASSDAKSLPEVASASSMNAFTSFARSRTGSYTLFKFFNFAKTCFASFWSTQKPSFWLIDSSMRISSGTPLFSKRVLPRVQRGLQFPNLFEESFHGGGVNKTRLLYREMSE